MEELTINADESAMIVMLTTYRIKKASTTPHEKRKGKDLEISYSALWNEIRPYFKGLGIEIGQVLSSTYLDIATYRGNKTIEI